MKPVFHLLLTVLLAAPPLAADATGGHFRPEAKVHAGDRGRFDIGERHYRFDRRFDARYDFRERHFRPDDRRRLLRPPDPWRRHDRHFGAGDRRFELHPHGDLRIHDHRRLLDRDRHLFSDPHHSLRPQPKRPGPERIVCYYSGTVLVCYGG